MKKYLQGSTDDWGWRPGPDTDHDHAAPDTDNSVSESSQVSGAMSETNKKI